MGADEGVLLCDPKFLGSDDLTSSLILEKALNKIVDSLGHEEAEDEADEPEIPSSKKTTKAPEPINPVGGRNSAQSKAVNKMSQAEYNAHMDKVESEKGRFW